jgi:myo-inositol 2-dehydrogenase/D-chiro-inositol 1-dehydrogenase
MRVAMIGAGNIGSKHLGLLAAEPDVELVGIVSPDPVRAQTAAEKWGGRSYTRLEELLTHEALDAAWVCVPPYAHGGIEAALIAAGIPFFVEKPLAADRATPEAIATALERNPVLAAVGYHWRAMDTIAEVRATIAENPPRLVLGAWHDAMPPPAWWRHQATSGGQIVEQATHLFDTARHLMGEATVVSATATHYGQAAYPDADVADVSAAILRFASGATGVLTATCLLGGLAAQYVQLVCERLLITITRHGVVYDTSRNLREVLLGNDPFQVEDRTFLKAIRSHDPQHLLCSYADALRTHRLCFDAVEAADSNDVP